MIEQTTDNCNHQKFYSQQAGHKLAFTHIYHQKTHAIRGLRGAIFGGAREIFYEFMTDSLCVFSRALSPSLYYCHHINISHQLMRSWLSRSLLLFLFLLCACMYVIQSKLKSDIDERAVCMLCRASRASALHVRIRHHCTCMCITTLPFAFLGGGATRPRFA